jgi:probable phosphoglycerate mutase
MHLYLIRHGESYVNLPGWNEWENDIGLTKRGHDQAEAAAKWLKANLPAPDRLYASTMLRARETAQYIADAYEIDIDFDTRLREIGNNRLDHTPLPDDGLARYADYWASARPFSNITPSIAEGESLMHFRTRVGMAIDSLLTNHLNETVMVVCHGFVIDTVFDIAFNIGAYRRCEVWSKNTGITYFEYINHPGREHWRLHRQNWTEHLTQYGIDHLK